MGFHSGNVEVQIEQPSGKRLLVLVSVDPLRDAGGNIIGAINCFQDITQHKLAQQQKLQIDELNHRVKNSLATVLSIAPQTFRNTEAAEQAKIFENRLIAVARAHDVLARQNWEHASLHDIVRDVVAPFCSGRLEFDGPEVRMDHGLAVSLALALQELATNALKYGGLSTPEGSVSFKWEVAGKEGSRKLALHWVEATSFAVQEPAGRGFGTSLIERMLKRQHDAEVRISYPPEGVRCEIVLPL